MLIVDNRLTEELNDNFITCIVKEKKMKERILKPLSPLVCRRERDKEARPSAKRRVS